MEQNNTIAVERAVHLDAIRDIIRNPTLFNCTYGQDPDDTLDLEGKEFLLVKMDDVNIGCFEIQEWTHKTLEAHIFVLPHYWKNSLEVVKAGEQWAREHKYTVITTKIPANCIHMLKFITRIDYKAAGLLHKAIVYNNQLVDLLLFEKQL